jgi:hypothetical protein
MAGGRPDKYNDEVKPKLDLIIGWARDGLTDELIAKNLGIGLSTLYKYKTLHIELVEALKKGKEVSDYEVESSLFKSANGFTYDEVTKESRLVNTIDGKPIYDLVITKIVTKQVQPNPTSMIFWLKNRKAEQWRDRQEFDIGNNLIPIKVVNDADRTSN